MKFKYLVFASIFIISSACKKEEITYNTFVIGNFSGVLVKVLPTSSMHDTLMLKNNELKEFEFSYERGKGTGDNYAFFADGNPVTVVFNKQDTITHYNDALSHINMNYTQTSVRNFYNTKSYLKDIVDDSKYQSTVTLKYIFTPRDYLDAQNK